MKNETQTILRAINASLSQVEIAALTGIPQPRLSKWINIRVPKICDDALRLLKLHQKMGSPSLHRARKPAKTAR